MTGPDAVFSLPAAQAKRFESAFALLRSGKPQEALKLSYSLVAEFKQSADAQQLLAMCLADTGETNLADAAFRNALALAPEHPLILINYAAMLRKLGRSQDALPLYKRAIDAAPTLYKAWIESGLTLIELGHHKDAVAELEHAVELQSDSALAWQALGRAHHAQDNLEAAEVAYRKAVSIESNRGACWANLGATLRMLGRVEEAIAAYQCAERAGVGGAALDDAYVGALLDAGHSQQALNKARDVVRRYPEFLPGYTTLAHLLWEYGVPSQPDDSKRIFIDAMREQPHNAALRLAFVRFLLARRSAEDALPQIQALRAINDSPALMALEADALHGANSYAQAGALYAQAYKEMTERSPAFLNAYTRHFLKMRAYDRAAECAEEALRIDAFNQEALAYLSVAWRLMDDPREFWLCDYDRHIALVDVEAPRGFNDMPDFLLQLSTALEVRHQAKRAPLSQSLRGGSQTPGRLFGRGDPVIDAAQPVLLQAVERWLDRLPSDNLHPFLKRKSTGTRIKGAWSVKLWTAGNHANHIHSEGWISSAFYVSLPPSVRCGNDHRLGPGFIQFGQPLAELGLDLQPRRILKPELGQLALFPSYMWHGTIPFDDSEPRVTIAFDILPTQMQG